MMGLGEAGNIPGSRDFRIVTACSRVSGESNNTHALASEVIGLPMHR